MSGDDQATDGAATEPEGKSVRRTPTFEYVAARKRSELDAKFAKLRAIARDADVDWQSKLADIDPPQVPSQYDMVTPEAQIDLLSSMVDIAPAADRRAAEAAELTVERLDTLVDAILASALAERERADAAAAREMVVDARENRMLGLAKVAAVSGVVGVLIGLFAIIVTLALA